MIEANHEEDEIRQRIEAKKATGEYIYEYGALENHLSKEKADEWLLRNMGARSQFVYMHRHEE